MNHRMVIAALALIGFFVALYLWLWKIGLVGEMACGSGGCETVQLSEHAVLFGQPVALYGVIGYLALFAVSLAGLQPRWLESKTPTYLLLGLSGVGVGFTAYLTYLEAVVIDAWCRWCIVSAVIITAIALVTLIGLRRGAYSS